MIAQDGGHNQPPIVYYTWCDRFCELLKYVYFTLLAISIHNYVQVEYLKSADEFNDIKFTWRDLGISLVAFAILRSLFDKVLFILFDIEAMSLYDRLMLEDDEKNWTNIMGACRFQKQDFNKLKDHLFERLKQIHRCQSKMVKILGVRHFKKMSDADFERVKDEII